MKRSIIALLITFAFSIFLSGCISSNNNEDYYKLAIGERFWENRDGCVYKLNDYTLLQKSFSDKENDFIKRIDAENTDEDIVNGSETLIEDKFKKCYCNNHYIILFLDSNEKIIVINCDDFSYQYYKELSNIPVSLNELTLIDFQ